MSRLAVSHTKQRIACVYMHVILGLIAYCKTPSPQPSLSNRLSNRTNQTIFFMNFDPPKFFVCFPRAMIVPSWSLSSAVVKPIIFPTLTHSAVTVTRSPTFAGEQYLQQIKITQITMKNIKN